MHKFKNVDIITSLAEIMRQNTAFFQSDFEIDKQIIQRAAASTAAEDKTLLWLSRPSGTHCFQERDVFLKDTAPHNTWLFYAEQTYDRILAYAIELAGNEGKNITGNLYELDYMQHYKSIKEKALPADTNILIYENGERVQPVQQRFDSSPDPQLGKFEHFEAQPNDPEALRYTLQEEKYNREKLKPGDFKAHIAALHNNCIEAEARHILSELQTLKEPNSPNQTHFMVEVSPHFMRLASSKDTEHLLAMLPFQTLTLGNLKDRHGVYAMVAKDENRDKSLRRPRQSIRARLTIDKEKTAPKKAATNSKNYDLEV